MAVLSIIASVALYCANRRDNQAKEQIAAAGSMVSEYDRLVAEGATILTEQAARQRFHRKARSLGIDPATIEGALFALGHHESGIYMRSMNKWYEDLCAHENHWFRDSYKCRKLKPLAEYVRATRAAEEQDFRFLEQEFALSRQEGARPPPGRPTSEFRGPFRRSTRKR